MALEDTKQLNLSSERSSSPFQLLHLQYVKRATSSSSSTNASPQRQPSASSSHSPNASIQRQDSSSSSLARSSGSPKYLRPSNMRKQEAAAHAKAAAHSLAHTMYRGVAGVPLGIAGAVSSAGGSVVSLAKGDFKKAAKRISNVPGKLVGGVGMSTLGAVGSGVDTLHHTLSCAGNGIAAVCNKVFRKDKEPKGRSEEESIYRAHERVESVQSTKRVTDELVGKVKDNTKWMTKDLLKP